MGKRSRRSGRTTPKGGGTATATKPRRHLPFADQHEVARWVADASSDLHGDWQGRPVPLTDQRVMLHPQHPLRSVYERWNAEMGLDLQIVVGGPRDDDGSEETVVNHWFSKARNAEVIVYHKDGKAFAGLIPRSPDRSMDRLDFWLYTLGSSDAWDLDAEHVAREKLRRMLSERQWRHYDLTGSFLETSPRSHLTYFFRRLRPTIVLSPHKRAEAMFTLAALCLHPIGYYEKSWGGCMVPSDDVIAHLTLMRADEGEFWAQANHHAPWRPEAGI